MKTAAEDIIGPPAPPAAENVCATFVQSICIPVDDAENIFKLCRAASAVIKFGKKGRDSFAVLREAIKVARADSDVR